MLSPEDVAWADSCLSKDPDMLDAGWNSLKDALFEASDAQHDPSLYEREYSLESDNMDVSPDENTVNDIVNVEEKEVSNIAAVGDGASSDLSIQFQSSLYDIDNMTFLTQPVLEESRSSEGRNDIRFSDVTPISIADTSDRAEATSTGVSNQENAFWSKYKMEDIFLPTYDENLKDLGLSDPEVDFVFQEFKLQQSTEDIFKIWDFDIPSEENDLIKQLDKALAGSPAESPSPPLFSDDSEAWKGLHDRSLDDLISGIADLTLSPNLDQRVLI